MAEIDSEAAAASLGERPGEWQGELRGVLPAGSRLRSYELISVLGRGAFGITYRALDTTLHRDVAIKEYLPTSLALRDGGTMVLPLSTELAEEFVWGRERFLDEARTLVKLDDVPAVVRVIDFLEDNGTAYMVMALARGETLAQRLRRGASLPPPMIERILYPLLDGLEQVHEVGFLHRDIKPANIILDARDNPTLIDFGAARAAMAGRSTAMTAIFTPGYAAAEQFTAARQGPWTDIYGLSATLYHAITGTVPLSAIDRMLDDTCAPLGKLLPAGFSPALLAGIDAGLAVRARERPDSIAAWRSIFIDGAPTTPGDAATEVVHKPSRAPAVVADRGASVPAERSRRFLWPALAAAAIVVVAGAGYVMFGSDRPLFGGQAVQSLTADQLEQALAERRKADAAAAEKKRLEEAAQRQADLDAKAKEAADAELVKAREQRQKAEAELATLKADMEARRQAEAAQREQAAAAARQALQEAEQRNKAETELAALRRADEEAKKQAAAAAAAQQQADEAAQRKVEAEAAALRQAEQEAQKKVVAEAEAKRQADEALAKAQAERKRADEEAARQKAELEARQKADADAKAKADADARARAEAAAKQKADADARAKAEADAAAEKKAAADAKAKVEADAAAEKKAAETAEGALRLTTVDRQRLQVALTSLGFDTRGSDGALGPRSREMIAAWQQKAGAPANGFVTASQRDQILRTAAAAVTRWDEEQKKIEDDKKKAEEEKKKADDEAKAKAAVAATPAPPSSNPATPSAPTASIGSPDGTWQGTYACGKGTSHHAQPFSISLTVQVSNGRGTVQTAGDADTGSVSVRIDGDAVRITRDHVNISTSNRMISTAVLAGTRTGNTVRVAGRETISDRDCTVSLTRK